MASSSSLAQWQNGVRAGDALETVEIDPQFASSLGFAEGSTVRHVLFDSANPTDVRAKLEIGLLHDLDVAKSVSTEPVSSDDWEILVRQIFFPVMRVMEVRSQELHAGYVEDNLLSQVRAASVGQEVDVWVLGRTRVRFRVGEFRMSGGYPRIAQN